MPGSLWTRRMLLAAGVSVCAGGAVARPVIRVPDRRPKTYQRLQQYWRRTGRIETAVLDEAAVSALERKHGIELPPDFRDYLLECCPAGNEMDGQLNEWWGADRLTSVAEEYEHTISNAAVAGDATSYIFFMDHCIWCWAYAIACGDDENRGKVVIIGGQPDDFVADSFAHFIDLYIKEIVYPWGPLPSA